MSDTGYNGEHSIDINVRNSYNNEYSGWFNSWNEWHLIPASRPYVKPPDLREEYIEIPGMPGALDYTELLSNRPIFSNRKGSWEFILPNINDGVDRGKNWAEEYSLEFLYRIHGRHCKVILTDDPEYYYEGRLKINDYKTEKERSSITIDYNLDPYKTPIVTDEEREWEWNQLFGLQSIIYGSFQVTRSKIRTLINATDEALAIGTETNAQMRAYKYPSVDSDSPSDIPITIPAGNTDPSDSQLVLDPGRTKYRFEGTGNIKLFYGKGRIL